jgi:hypothetical protein
VEIQSSAGWGLAESMLSGTVTVQGNAGNCGYMAGCMGQSPIYLIEEPDKDGMNAE